MELMPICLLSHQESFFYKDPRNYTESMEIVKVDHLLSFLSNKNVSMEQWQKLDKTVVETFNLRNQVAYKVNQQH